jgi:hypothetical protein
VDGIDRKTSESELIGELLQKHVAGDKVKVAVVRGHEHIDLMLPIQ